MAYGFSAQVGPQIRPHLGFSYERAGISGNEGETADLYRFSLGAGYPIFNRASLGLTYSLNIRTSDVADRDYLENRLSLVASYRF